MSNLAYASNLVEKALLKRCVFKDFFKVSTDLAILISRGKSFQSLSEEATKAGSPKVFKVLKFEWDSSIPTLDCSVYLEFKGLILTRSMI